MVETEWPGSEGWGLGVRLGSEAGWPGNRLGVRGGGKAGWPGSEGWG